MAETEAGTGRAAGEATDGSATPASARPAPDFSALALQHLGQRCDAFRQHVREHLERPAADAPRARLDDDLRRLRNTLVLLERTGAVFVAEELLALLAARTAGEIDDEDEFARVLVSAGERLGDHVARLERRGAGAEEDRDGALGLLPLVNDSRACRDAPLLSGAIVAAVGVELPEPAGPDAPGADDGGAGGAFRARVAARREALTAALREWSGAAPGDASRASTATAADAFDELSALCVAPSLAHLAPALDAAVVLATGIADGAVADGIAPRRLFGQLERWLHEAVETSPTDDAEAASPVPAPPEELQRNLLYYASLVAPSTSPRAEALHGRFALARFRPTPSDARTGSRAGSAPGSRSGPGSRAPSATASTWRRPGFGSGWNRRRRRRTTRTCCAFGSGSRTWSRC